MGFACAARSQTSTQSAAGPSADSALEEVVVTARQRSERLIDVPVTEEAFTAADIKAAGIERPQEFLELTPGVSFVKAAEAGDLQVSIRGLNTGRDSEPNFAFVVDGVLQTNPFALSQELTNLQQIEVVKGPQGAVYGRNAVAGAIIIDTRKPTDQVEFDGTVGYGDYHSPKANFWISGPIADGFDAGINAFYTKTNGFFSNSYLGCDNCVDFYEEYGAAPRLIIKAGDNGTLDVKAKYSRINDGAINYNASFALPAFAGLNPDFYQNVNDHVFDYINDVVPKNVQTNEDFSIKGDWKYDIGTLTAWYAFNDQTNYFLTDGTSAAFGLYSSATLPNGTLYCAQDLNNAVGGPLPSPTFYAGAASILPPYSPSRCDGYQYQERNQIDNSFEVRLTSPSDQALRWLGGIYAADIRRHVVVSQGSDRGLGFLDQPFVPTSGPNPTDLLYDDSFTSKVGAAFGQVSYDLMSNLEGAIALRYDYEHRGVDNNVPKVNPQTPGFGAFGVPDCPLGPNNGTCTSYINPYYNVNPTAASIPSRSANFSEPEPKVTLNWKFVPDWSAFASWGVGFRSGGFNSSGSAATVTEFLGNLHYVTPAGVVTAIPAISGVSDEYKKEVSKASEIGVKGELLDRSVFLSADYYYTRVDNMQIFNFFAGPFGLLRVVTNIDEATLQGVEGDARWKINPYVSLFAGAATVDSKINSYTGRPYTDGNKVPYAPDYTADAGVTFTLPIAATGDAVIARLDATSTGKTWFSPVQNNSVQTEFGAPGNYSKAERNAFTLLNARLGYNAKNWDVTAWIRNLTNKEYLSEVIPAPEFGGSFVQQGQPRFYGVDFTYRFVGGSPSTRTPAAPVAAAPPPPSPPPPPPPVAVAPAAPPPPPAPPAPQRELVLKGVNFETASAKLLPSSRAVLDSVAGNIVQSGSRKVDIRGYTDSVGKRDYNQKLSERRANSVKEYLESHGVPAGVLTAEGFGEERPIASNQTAAGRAENRRVTVQFSEIVP
jgi:iron complex outermembrane receptor protein